MEVGEAVDGTTGDEDGVAGADEAGLAGEGKGEGSFEAVDGFFVGVVAVGDGDAGCGLDVELEDGDGVAGGGAVDEEADGEAADADLFGGGGHGWF